MWAFLQAVHCVTFQLMSWQSCSQWWCCAKLVAERNEMKYGKTREGTMGKHTWFWQWREIFRKGWTQRAWMNMRFLSRRRDGAIATLVQRLLFPYYVPLLCFFFILPKLLPHFCDQMSHLDSFSKAQDGDHRFFQVCFTLSDNKLLLSPAVRTWLEKWEWLNWPMKILTQ